MVRDFSSLSSDFKLGGGVGDQERQKETADQKAKEKKNQRNNLLSLNSNLYNWSATEINTSKASFVDLSTVSGHIKIFTCERAPVEFDLL